MPRMDGLEFLSRLSEMQLNAAVIVLTAQGSIERAVEAMKMGAYDFIQKPIDPTRLKTVLANASRQRETERELKLLAASYGIQVFWVRWWAVPKKCRKCSP